MKELAIYVALLFYHSRRQNKLITDIIEAIEATDALPSTVGVFDSIAAITYFTELGLSKQNIIDLYNDVFKYHFYGFSKDQVIEMLQFYRQNPTLGHAELFT